MSSGPAVGAQAARIGDPSRRLAIADELVLTTRAVEKHETAAD